MAHNVNFSSILLVGAGAMAREYMRVLDSKKVKYTVVCNTVESAKKIKLTHACKVVSGGLEKYLRDHQAPEFAVVATPVDSLYAISKMLINCGVRNILLEKPGAIYNRDLRNLSQQASYKKSNVYIAYNRRFYGSVEKLCELSKQDGGIKNIYFDFTELSDEISRLKIPDEVKARWALANSSHVFDLVVFLGGSIRKLNTNAYGGLDWHKSGAYFSGTGMSIHRIPFAYRSDWSSPGRWEINVYSENYKFILSPLEDLKAMMRGSFEIKDVNLESRDDNIFKPGLYKMVSKFLSQEVADFCSIHEHCYNFKHYCDIVNYDA